MILNKIKNLNPLVLIPARGGSKSIPNKNIKCLDNKPLIQYTINEAKKIFNKESICVSTDSIEIKKVVEKLGIKIPFLRPKELAKDTTPTRDVILHALKYFENKGVFYNIIILLQPTSPFRNSKHILDSFNLYNNKLDMVVSVKKSKANPYFNLYEENDKGKLFQSKKSNFIRRQDCNEVFQFNGAIYVINSKSIKEKQIHDFNEVIKFQMDEISSIDIDDMGDWVYAEYLLKYKKNDL
tara:strand:+ start:6469 stop:7185 length:717 start_codon:yes stop_codon:yes gene_type:complete